MERNRKALSADLAHRSRWPNEVDLIDLMPGPLGSDGPLNLGGQRIVVAAASNEPKQIELGCGKQTGSKLAIGSEPHSVAVAAERFGNGWDDPNH